MSAAPSVLEAVTQANAVPFAGVYVTLTKCEHIELAVERVKAEQREVALRVELDLAQAKVRDLQQRLFGRKSEGGQDS